MRGRYGAIIPPGAPGGGGGGGGGAEALAPRRRPTLRMTTASTLWIRGSGPRTLCGTHRTRTRGEVWAWEGKDTPGPLGMGCTGVPCALSHS